MIHTLFSPTTGRILGRTSKPELHSRWASLPGDYDSKTYYVKDGKPKAYPRAPGIREIYDWDLSTESWVLNTQRAAALHRQSRNRMLAAVDRVNPLWYVSLGVERQVALQEYRQALLSVPQQPGFPDQVIWPTKPPWL